MVVRAGTLMTGITADLLTSEERVGVSAVKERYGPVHLRARKYGTPLVRSMTDRAI